MTPLDGHRQPIVGKHPALEWHRVRGIEPTCVDEGNLVTGDTVDLEPALEDSKKDRIEEVGAEPFTDFPDSGIPCRLAELHPAADESVEALRILAGAITCTACITPSGWAGRPAR